MSAAGYTRPGPTARPASRSALFASPFRRLALFASGPDLDVLEQVAVDVPAYVVQGVTVWMAAVVATAGATLGASLWDQGAVAIRWQYMVTGIAVGCLVFTVDTVLVRLPLNPFKFPDEILAVLRGPVSQYEFNAALATLYRPSALARTLQWRSILVPLAIRGAIALCTSFVIANLVLFIFFAPEIKQRVVHITQATEQALIREINQTYDTHEQRLKAQINALSPTGNTALSQARATLSDLENSLSNVNDDLTTLHAAYLAETHGIPREFVLSDGQRLYTSNFAGTSKTAHSIQIGIIDKQATKTTILGEISTEKRTVAAAQARAQEALFRNRPLVGKLRAELNVLEADRQRDLNAVTLGGPAAKGILVQYEALNQLEHDANPQTPRVDAPPACRSTTCRIEHFLYPATPLGAWVVAFRAFFLLVDMLPIIVKAHFSMRERRPYDALRAAHEEISIADTYKLLHDELLQRREQMDARVAAAAARLVEPGA